MKTLLIVEKNPTGSIGLCKAKEKGLFIIFLSSNKYLNKINREDLKYIDKFVEINTSDINLVVNYCCELNKKHKIDGVITFFEYYVPLCSHIAHALKLPGNSPESAMNARNKFLMRNAFKENHIPIPLFKGVSSLEDALDFAKTIGYPNIIKPINMAASRLVLKNSNQSELINHYSNIAVTEAPFGMKNENIILIEEFMEGQEYSVESVTYHGKTTVIAITKKTVKGIKNFVEVAHVIPATLNNNEKDSIVTISVSAISALGLTHGVTHTELKMTSTGPKIVEIAARLAGDRIPELVELSFGIDMWKSAISLSIGEKPDIVQKRNKSVTIQFITADPGIIRSIDGVEKAKKSHGVLELHFEAKVGDIVPPLENNLNRLGEIIATGDSSSESEMNALNALKQIIIETK